MWDIDKVLVCENTHKNMLSTCAFSLSPAEVSSTFCFFGSDTGYLDLILELTRFQKISASRYSTCMSNGLLPSGGSLHTLIVLLSLMCWRTCSLILSRWLYLLDNVVRYSLKASISALAPSSRRCRASATASDIRLFNLPSIVSKHF